ncbi:hypothetical protein [Natronosalvus halobius]|uniref:hypothetical protein n=1 Tax=Natronosalvus halobius TaxID=2953746 RepID=UPI00209E1015|nr:hypothetical protein [Natronosalvus halobius]USZ73767.1 hypothetical protein NGM15_18345 [Natronosalvus halobius]
MSLPDPETTECEPIEIDDDEVLEQIPEDNPFKAAIVEMKDDDASWTEVLERLEDAYNPIDKTAYKESMVRMPEYRIRAVVHCEQSTSGERYESFTHADETEDAAIEWAESKHDVLRVESTEKVGMVTVG